MFRFIEAIAKLRLIVFLRFHQFSPFDLNTLLTRVCVFRLNGEPCHNRKENQFSLSFAIASIFFYVFLFVSVSGVSAEEQYYRFAILGESFQPQPSEKGFNEKVLGQLFEKIKEENPDAVFFTGNLIFGFEVEEGKNHEIFRYRDAPRWMQDVIGNTWPEKGNHFEEAVFSRQLKAFSLVLNQKLGKEIRFYPIGGSHEAISPNAERLFQEHFALKTEAPDFLDAMGYTVSVGNVFFLLLPTSQYDKEKGIVGEFPFSYQYLRWIDQVLQQASQKYSYLFVIGNKPAFSTTATYGLYRGLEKTLDDRNRFWDILKQRGVTAYFSGYEPLFDRSVRQGIWQLISGGAGAPFSQKFAEKTFYHFILLLIPKDGRGAPQVKVIDNEGNIRDEFELESERTPLYQFRISSKLP